MDTAQSNEAQLIPEMWVTVSGEKIEALLSCQLACISEMLSINSERLPR